MSRRKVCEDATVLELGARGRLEGEPFTLVGRTCVRSDGGGMWNEWMMRVGSGDKTRVRWLAEARGTFTLFDEGAVVPSWDSLAPGATIEPPWVVVERGTAERVAHLGEAPASNARRYRYADLSSREGLSATIDYGGPAPVTFVGRHVRLADLELTPRRESPRFFVMPDAPKPKGVDLLLAIGDQGELDATRFRVIGVLARSMRAEGERFAWQEYLLHEANEGFRWLVVSDGHWSFVEAIEPGLVFETESSATYEGDSYEPLGHGKARVDWATGELPWDVHIGDTSEVRDYVHAPHILSREATEDEVTWSRASYVYPDVVAHAFDKPALPKPVGRAPNQPKMRRKSSGR